MRSPNTRLKKARRTLRFVSEYMRMQVAFVKAGAVSKPETVKSWRERYMDVCGMTQAWADKALLATRKTARRRSKDL